MDRWLVNVPVATVWTSYNSARDIDMDAVSNPAHIESWLAGLNYQTRLDLFEQNLVQTQVLFGQEVLLIEEKDNWAQIIIPDQPTSKDERGYPGWVPKSQLVCCAEEWRFQKRPIAVVTSPKANLFTESLQFLMELSFQTNLPFLNEHDGKVYVKTPTGTGVLDLVDVVVFNSTGEILRGNGINLVSTGEQFLHLPYLWGGVSSYGFDCSGFCYTVYKANGYLIPRDARDQADSGFEVNLSDIMPGDLIFFA
ncbi:MAG: C40 family peptidase, partial [Neobacillus sp.]